MARIVLVGANHAGTAAANTILDQYPDNELVIFDRNSNISYLGCGTALWIGGQIDSPNGLFYSSGEKLRAKNATVYMETEVTHIDFAARNVHGRAKDGREITQAYDKLILASGSLPIVPPIPGAGLGRVQSVKLYQDAQVLNALLDEAGVRSVAVIGAGYIGVELAEAIKRRGKNALLFELSGTSLSGYYDPWFTQDMDRVLAEHGVELHFGQAVQSLEGARNVEAVVTDKGRYPVDAAILSIGFRPDNALGKNDLELFPNGAYRVNARQETSLPGVYAVGDCATVQSNATQQPAYIALATNAVRSGIVAAHNACGTALESPGVQGSNGISIFGHNMVSTGLNLAAAEKAGYAPAYTEYEDLQRPAFMKNNHPVKLRVVYDSKTRRILGAQMASLEDISMGIHMFSLAIAEKLTVDKLKLLDIFFLPHFNQPYNYITMAALGAK
jgi:NADPH-dependent 2,4-dienoyl-CoA reductase/sulfur reductase-like enzyme